MVDETLGRLEPGLPLTLTVARTRSACACWSVVGTRVELLRRMIAGPPTPAGPLEGGVAALVVEEEAAGTTVTIDEVLEKDDDEAMGGGSTAPATSPCGAPDPVAPQPMLATLATAAAAAAG